MLSIPPRAFARSISAATASRWSGSLSTRLAISFGSIGTPIEAHFTQFVEDAYLQAQPQQVAVYVINEGDGQFEIFDDHCTHLGCPFSWDADQNQFNCPCHNGVFDPEGRVLGGPPPRPLDHYEFKVENGVLYAGKLFRVNDQLQRITR